MNVLKPRVIILVISFFAFYQLNAQTFEGTVKWSITAEFLSEQRLKKADKEAQAQERSMPIPEMKPVAGADTIKKAPAPEAKKRPEEQPKADIPKTLLIRTKNGNSVLKTDLDKQPETLYLKGKDQMFQINHRRKIFTELKNRKKKTPESQEVIPEFLPSTETEKILDFKCTKYARSFKQNNKVISQEMWITNEITDLDLSVLGKLPIARNIIPMEKIKGVPLKIVMLTPEGRFTMQATELKREKIDEKLFSIPTDYRDAAAKKKNKKS
jgi:hypothetical protein